MTQSPGQKVDVEKFHSNGQPKLFKGTTIVCHIPREEKLFQKLLDVYRHLVGSNYTKKFSLLPTSSYHITIIGTSNRRVIPRKIITEERDDQEDKIAEKVYQRLQNVHELLNFEFPLSFRSVGFVFGGNTLSLRMEPLHHQKPSLETLRSQISDALGLKEEHGYYYHVTLAYFIEEFDELDRSEFLESIPQLNKLVEGSIVSFNQMEFCTFHDMFDFAIKHVFE